MRSMTPAPTDEPKFLLPPIYPLVAELLEKPITRLREALFARVIPNGEPVELDEAAAGLDSFTDHLGRLTAAVERLGSEVMHPELAAVADADAMRVVDLLDDAVADYITDALALLRRPWPVGAEIGRLLVAAFLDRPLRDLLLFLEKVRDTIRNPGKAMAAAGGPVVDLQLVLDVDEEVRAFEEWAKRFDQERWLRTAAERRRQSSSLWSIAAGFLFGYWIGKD